MWQLDYAKASHFDLTDESCWRRGGKRSIASSFNPYLIVGHEPRFQITLRRKGEKAEREVRFAAARAPADKNGVWAKRHAGAMDKLAALYQSRLLYEPQAAGSRITKRAPPLLRSAAPTLLELKLSLS